MIAYASWADVLAAAKATSGFWYQAPLDRHVTWVRIVRVFKNGRLRLTTGLYTFTADAGHLPRFMRREGSE